MREGHECSWFIIDETDKICERCLKGLIPPPLQDMPKFSDYELVIFDSTGHGELADESAKESPTIGDSLLASRLEDDRLYGIETMESCGIEVPKYSVFTTPEEAKPFIAATRARYVYKPFEPEDPTEHQESDATYVSESADDMLNVIDKLFVRALAQPFILQEVVSGTEVSAEGYFDSQNFYLINLTIEEKKFMAGGYGPNTGCAGNLIHLNSGARLVSAGLLKLTPFLRDAGYRGMIDLNTIVNEEHTYGLEFTPRFGYDSDSTLWSLLETDSGHFLHDIATGPVELDPVPFIVQEFAASARYSIPPYPTEVKGKHPRGIPITGISIEDAWKQYYLYDAMEGEEGLVTAGVTGFVCCPIARGNTASAAWDGVERLAKNLKIPNVQCRDDLRESTCERLSKLKGMGWL